MVKHVDFPSGGQLIDSIETDLNHKEQNRFIAMLKEFEEVFDDKPGRTPNGEHAIDTGEAVPCKSRPRRIPPQWEEEINAQLNELLEQ